jgi:hypothetical protein
LGRCCAATGGYTCGKVAPGPQQFAEGGPVEGGGQGPLDNEVLRQHFEALARNRIAVHRTPAKDADAQSTVLTIGVNDPRLNDGKPTVIPTVWDGKVLNQEQAIRRAAASGRQWPSFDNFDQADAADTLWHGYMHYMGGAPYRGFADGGSVDEGIVPVDQPTQSCPAGYHWDADMGACVKDAASQSQSRGGIPSNVLQMSKLAGAGATSAGGAEPALAGLGGTSTGSVLGDFGLGGADLAPFLGTGADAGYGAATAGIGSEGVGGAGSAAALINPWTALGAAIVGSSVGLDHNKISSFKHQLQGKTIDDILHSPNVQNHVRGWIGDKATDELTKAIQPIADSADPIHGWKNIPEDAWKASVAPFKFLKKAIG